MARRLGFAVSRTFSSLATARTLIPAHIDERDLNQRVLESELLLAVYADVPVLVTADTPATAKRIAYAIQERLEPRQIPLAVVNSNVTATSTTARTIGNEPPVCGMGAFCFGWVLAGFVCGSLLEGLDWGCV